MSRRNKILLVTPTFPKLSETFIVNKFLGLLDSGWDVHVLCRTSPMQEWERFPGLCRSEHQHRIHAALPTSPAFELLAGLPVLFSRWLRHPASSWLQCKALKGLSRQKAAELVYLDSALHGLNPNIVHFEFAALAVERTYLKKWFDCKLTCSFRGYDLNLVALDDPNYYQALWQEVDAVHCLGEGLWKRALQRGCPADTPRIIIPPAIDTHLFAPSENRKKPNKGSIALLSVGRLEWIKGYEYTLQAVRHLKDRRLDCTLTIIGSGPALESIAFARHQLGLQAEVHLLGAQPQKVIREQMAGADVFVHSAVSEGFCNAVLEAQSMELPVVCSDADGLQENIVDGVTGYLVPRRDPAAMAERIAFLAQDAAKREQMGKAGRERVLSAFRLPQQQLTWHAFYENLLLSSVRETKSRHLEPVTIAN